MSSSLDTAGYTSYSLPTNGPSNTIFVGSSGGAGGNGGNAGIVNEFTSPNYIGDEFWY